MTEDALEHWAERAAIREMDGGLPREEADAMALGDVAVKYGWPVAVALAGKGDEIEAGNIQGADH